jgi:hypothetical protein
MSSSFRHEGQIEPADVPKILPHTLHVAISTLNTPAFYSMSKTDLHVIIHEKPEGERMFFSIEIIWNFVNIVKNLFFIGKYTIIGQCHPLHRAIGKYTRCGADGVTLAFVHPKQTS